MAGNVRDTRIILQMENFPVFTMGTVANARTGWKVNEINEIIFMPGHLRHSVRVFPGDFIFGDTDGVQIIPKEMTDEVMLLCEGILDKEKYQRTRNSRRSSGGGSLSEIWQFIISYAE